MSTAMPHSSPTRVIRKQGQVRSRVVCSGGSGAHTVPTEPQRGNELPPQHASDIELSRTIHAQRSGIQRLETELLAVRHWTHHVRAHNKMADLLANLAMDTPTSSQVTHPTARSGHATLHAHLSNDISPWLVDTVDRRAGLPVLR
jgi:hypothetical protein